MAYCFSNTKPRAHYVPCSLQCVGIARPATALRRRAPAAQGTAVDTKSVMADLLADISSIASSSGLETPPELKAQILNKVEQLKAAQQGSTTTNAKSLSATWKLLWTTEKETLFIMKNAPLFRTKAGGVYQVIDVNAKRLQNVITFPPDGAFIVDSRIAVEGPQRVSFKFNAAKLKTAGRDWRVPPFGQGWFDTVYCDGNIRIAQDIRGDTLIVENDGPPRIFA